MPIRKSNDTLFYLIGIIPVVWLALLLAQSLGGGLPELLRNLTSALEQPTNIVWTDKSLPTILICLAAYGMAVLLYRTNQGRTRDGEEHGSAAWATPASVNAQFAQKDSIPLTQHVRLGLNTHKHRRSLNVLVIGGSGAAKTRSFVLPNILTTNTNYVITDPKSEVLLATGGYLKEQGYDVRVLNLVNLEQSDGYNPFRYLRDEKDVLKLVNNLIQSTTRRAVTSPTRSGPKPKPRSCRPSFSCCFRKHRNMSRTSQWSCACWNMPRCARKMKGMCPHSICSLNP